MPDTVMVWSQAQQSCLSDLAIDRVARAQWGEPSMFHNLYIMPPCCAAMSYLVLGDLAVNTLRSMVSAQWQDKAAWGTSSAIAALADSAKQVRRGSGPSRSMKQRWQYTRPFSPCQHRCRP